MRILNYLNFNKKTISDFFYKVFFQPRVGALCNRIPPFYTRGSSNTCQSQSLFHIRRIWIKKHSIKSYWSYILPWSLTNKKNWALFMFEMVMVRCGSWLLQNYTIRLFLYRYWNIPSVSFRFHLIRTVNL